LGDNGPSNESNIVNQVVLIIREEVDVLFNTLLKNGI